MAPWSMPWPYYLGTEEDIPILPGNDRDRVGLVHRIDKDTSGLLVIAKTERAMGLPGPAIFRPQHRAHLPGHCLGCPGPTRTVPSRGTSAVTPASGRTTRCTPRPRQVSTP